jgi:prepilin peptidase dependent protein B
MHLKHRKKLLGFTLTELLIAVVINAIIFTAVIGIFIANLNHYVRVLNTNRMNQQMQAAMAIIVADIRRAGYWVNAKNDVGNSQNTNPFMASGLDISVGASNTCILMSYDKNGSGTLPAISAAADDERYGYRLTNNAVQARPWGAAFNCAAAASAWENMTDVNAVKITTLNFALTTQAIAAGGSSTIGIRSVDITITGQLPTDSTVTKTLTEHIRVRNDKFVP